MRTLAKLFCALFATAALVLAFPAPRASTQGPSDPSAAGAVSLPAAILQARLLPPDPASMDSLGDAVALSADGNTALVGAPFHRPNVIDSCGNDAQSLRPA